MEYKIRRKEQKDCYDVAHVVTVAWQETYRGGCKKSPKEK